MSRRQTFINEGGAGRQREGVLGDIVGRIGQQALAEGLSLLFSRTRANQHAVAPGAMDLLDHHQLKVTQHIAQVLCFPALPGGDIAEDRLFTEVKADHLRNVRVD